jgi:hypothetical protein
VSPDSPTPSGGLSGQDLAMAAAAAAAIAEHLTTLADGMRTAATSFPAGSAQWQGTAARLLGHLLAAKPERFAEVANACAGAAVALSQHADQLSTADWLRRQAVGSQAALADELQRRAAHLADESARQAAAAVLSLARSAPARQSRWRRWTGQLEAWRSEVVLGAAESTEQIVDVTAQVAVRVHRPYDPRNIGDLRNAGSALAAAGRHPGETAKAVLDWDTWRTNPARAAGHLLPDVAVALASGGAAASSRAAEVAGRSRAAVEAAAARDVVRRQTGADAAAEARRSLIDKSMDAAGRPGAVPWRGEGGTRLSPGQNASTEAFHTLSSAREPEITEVVREVSRTAEAELAGLRNRLKDVDSLKRKLATQQANTGRRLPKLLEQANDAVRYTVVINETDYVHAVPQVAGQLEQQGFHLLGSPNNAWRSGRYRGLNTTWVDPAGGAAFEVQFHTPASWRITRQTHPLYEESRLPDVSPERKAELQAQIAAAYQDAPRPAGVESLNRAALQPPSAPDAIVPPANYTVHAAVGAGVEAELLQAEHRPSQN